MSHRRLGRVCKSMLAAAAVVMLGAMPVSADTLEKSVTRQLRDMGYGEIESSRTLLGRLRVVARRGGEEREIVINRSTGAVLRDFSRDTDPDHDEDDVPTPNLADERWSQEIDEDDAREDDEDAEDDFDEEDEEDDGDDADNDADADEDDGDDGDGDDGEDDDD